MKKIVIMVVAAIMMFSCTACGKSVPIDFADAESFEAALNAGENLEGKVVQFIAGEFHPDSAMGYDVWAGEHLNFVSSSHPNIAQGDVVVVRVTKIENVLGSWVIAYEKVDNGEIDDNTKSSENSVAQNTGDDSTAVADSGSAANNTDENNDSTASSEGASITVTDKKEPSIEAVDANLVAFRGYSGPMVSAYVAFKNTSDYPITIKDPCINYEDNNGKLLSADTAANCIPEAVKPGQIGYIYSYYHDISSVDISNGFTFEPEGQIVEATNFYEIEVSDVSSSTDDFMDVIVIGRGTNNSGKDQPLAKPGAVFFDKEGKVMGFCYGIESFDNGQTKSFKISGDLMSEDFNKEDLDHVEVYIQSDSWF